MIPDAKVSEIRERMDIVEVIGEYVTLRRAGANLKGVCPFHADSDPSFNVNPARQFFHCFGCGASGDLFGFVMRMEGISFTEAARRLAARAGVTLPEPSKSPQARTQEEARQEARKRRRFVLEEAAAFFETQLQTAAGKRAREAIAARGISEEVAARYRLGYAPDAWSSLLDHMGPKRISPKELETVGLVLQRKGGSGCYDRFRDRLMFTITDPGGQPIAFSGRALNPDEAARGAKYINSPETEEYTKGKVLFGLHQARVAMSKSQEAILVEGNFDVVSLAEAGIENVVAPLGTALTSEQALLLRRRVERVVLMFDGDEAGRKASTRAFPILANAGLASYSVPLPSGEDPDSLVRTKGADEVVAMIEKKSGLLDQIIQLTAATCDGSLQDKARKIEKLKPFIHALGTRMEMDLYRGRIAALFNVDERVVFRALSATPPPPDAGSGDASGPLPLPGRLEERELVGLLLDFPDFYTQAEARGVLEYISSPSLRRVIERIGFLLERRESSVAELQNAAGDPRTARWLGERAMVCLYTEKEKANQAFEEVSKKLGKRPIREQIKELDQQIRLASAAGDDARVLELSRKKADLQGLQ